MNRRPGARMRPAANGLMLMIRNPLVLISWITQGIAMPNAVSVPLSFYGCVRRLHSGTFCSCCAEPAGGIRRGVHERRLSGHQLRNEASRHGAERETVVGVA